MTPDKFFCHQAIQINGLSRIGGDARYPRANVNALRWICVGLLERKQTIDRDKCSFESGLTRAGSRRAREAEEKLIQSIQGKCDSCILLFSASKHRLALVHFSPSNSSSSILGYGTLATHEARPL